MGLPEQGQIGAPWIAKDPSLDEPQKIGFPLCHSSSDKDLRLLKGKRAAKKSPQSPAETSIHFQIFHEFQIEVLTSEYPQKLKVGVIL
jgi:hypothetical protein